MHPTSSEWSLLRGKFLGDDKQTGKVLHPNRMPNRACSRGSRFVTQWKKSFALLMVAALMSPCVLARDLKITIPRRSHLTPVQRLNREGVEALKKKNYEKAKRIFYRAYLLDPDDPFTLNNLGYVSELKGQVDRAHEFYTLANRQASSATIDVATSKSLQGHSMQAALGVTALPLEINHDNVEAVRLLAQGRAPEVDVLLSKALAHDPQNVFTMNNLGVAKEMEGESQEALKYYDYVAATHSDAAAIVTLDQHWRGKPVREVAAQNAKALRARLQTENTLAARVAGLNLRGVSALNRNDIQTAIQDFHDAYRLDPNNAFALNNIGYVYELQGDRETAQFYYESAQRAGGANLSVGLATRRSAEGRKLFQVATDSNSNVENVLTQERGARREQRGPVVLLRRDNSIVQEPAARPQNSTPH
jgi:Flp pilus assembly protein TadD